MYSAPYFAPTLEKVRPISYSPQFPLIGAICWKAILKNGSFVTLVMWTWKTSDIGFRTSILKITGVWLFHKAWNSRNNSNEKNDGIIAFAPYLATMQPFIKPDLNRMLICGESADGWLAVQTFFIFQNRK